MVQWATNKDKTLRFWMRGKNKKKRKKRKRTKNSTATVVDSSLSEMMHFFTSVWYISFCHCNLECFLLMMMVLMLFVICLPGPLVFRWRNGDANEMRWYSNGGNGNNKNNKYDNKAFQLWSCVPVCSLYSASCLIVGALDIFSRRSLFVSLELAHSSQCSVLPLQCSQCSIRLETTRMVRLDPGRAIALIRLPPQCLLSGCGTEYVVICFEVNTKITEN